MEPNSNHRTASLPGIMVQGNEGPVYLDCESVVSSVMLALAHATTHNPEWVLDILRDMDAVAMVEARGMSVSDRGTEDILRDLYNAIGTPVLEMSAGKAITYAKRLNDAADAVSNEIDRDTRRQFRLREAQQLVSEAAAQNTAAQAVERTVGQETGSHNVQTLASAKLGEPRPAFGGAPATHTGAPAQHGSGRAHIPDPTSPEDHTNGNQK